MDWATTVSSNMTAIACSNCKAPVNDQVDGHCLDCRKEAAKAPKMADDINNVMERAGQPIRWTEDQVRGALLEQARQKRQGGRR